MKNFYDYISNRFASRNTSDKKSHTPTSCYLYELSAPTWTSGKYSSVSVEGYMKNVIANRCINLIARSAANLDWRLYSKKSSEVIKAHPILDLLHHPNPSQGGAEFFESLYSHKILSGNAYILGLKSSARDFSELHLLRPDRVELIAGKSTLPFGYKYSTNSKEQIFKVDPLTGRSDILHLKNFHPLDDLYGLSQVEAAAYSIDLHNQAAMWNKSLLQNGARPSGALVVKSEPHMPQSLTEDQFKRLKTEIDEQFSGVANAGRPILLEGGLDWKEMSMSPKDMDFIEAKNSAARDIALAFGVPPQLLGIPGDNTYSNLQEARLAFWEETIIPLVDKTVDGLNNWMVRVMAPDLRLCYDSGNITALSAKHERVWARVKDASFMTDAEKRAAVGLG